MPTSQHHGKSDLKKIENTLRPQQLNLTSSAFLYTRLMQQKNIVL